jgi:hypothetical protein
MRATRAHLEDLREGDDDAEVDVDRAGDACTRSGKSCGIRRFDPPLLSLNSPNLNAWMSCRESTSSLISLEYLEVVILQTQTSGDQFPCCWVSACATPVPHSRQWTKRQSERSRRPRCCCVYSHSKIPALVCSATAISTADLVAIVCSATRYSIDVTARQLEKLQVFEWPVLQAALPCRPVAHRRDSFGSLARWLPGQPSSARTKPREGRAVE